MTQRALRSLAPTEYGHLTPMLTSLEMNTLFARAVLEQRVPGRVFADCAESPGVGYIVHDYGMSLLFGAADDTITEQVLGMPRQAPEWLQVAGPSCRPFTSARGIEEHTRVNFVFGAKEWRARTPRLTGQPYPIVRADRRAFDMPGSVVPRAFWHDADRFLNEGAGFSVIIDDVPAALAFSAFITPTQLEIGIETREAYRGRGFAALACAALIDHCVERGLEPVWACRLANTASKRLAERLGFTATLQLPYFRMPPTPKPPEGGRP